MNLVIEAACGCNRGKIRSNNEDNVYFFGRCLPLIHDGTKKISGVESGIQNGLFLAVFDGMGGESCGEEASFAAAQELQLVGKKLIDYFFPEREFLTRTMLRLNDAVVKRAHELCVERMGSTLVALYFSAGNVYVCNLGDSRAYRLRYGEFMQLSQDHVYRSTNGRKKSPLTQYLGIDPDYMTLEPFICKGSLIEEDQYLLCSDGLTDMLSNMEIMTIMLNSKDSRSCASQLIDAALKRGGQDNVTVIVCKIKYAEERIYE